MGNSHEAPEPLASQVFHVTVHCRRTRVDYPQYIEPPLEFDKGVPGNQGSQGLAFS
jgi:hypothetical protein